MKVEIFDITTKKEDDIRQTMSMQPVERLILCLDLMDLSLALSPSQILPTYADDSIEWITLKFKDAKSNS